MFRKIIGLLMLYSVLSIQLFSMNSQIPIKKLSNQDPNFVLMHNLIINNKTVWLKIKNKFQISDVQNIKPLSMGIYTVQEGDTIFSIAEQMGLNSDSLISFNSLANSLSINPGDSLLIPSMDGVIIFPAADTSTERIAHIYNVPEPLLLFVNSIMGGTIHPKEEVFIPFGKMSDEEKNYFLFQPFSFPLASGKFSSNYGMRFHPVKKRWVFHGGVDIATPTGSNVYATADGTVVYSGASSGGYGILVVIKHKYGYTSWYGHLSKVKVKVGDRVKNRDIIAISGSTGISTGPHLHFEIRRFNLRENPMEILTFEHQATAYDSGDKQDNTLEDFTD